MLTLYVHPASMYMFLRLTGRAFEHGNAHADSYGWATRWLARQILGHTLCECLLGRTL